MIRSPFRPAALAALLTLGLAACAPPADDAMTNAEAAAEIEAQEARDAELEAARKAEAEAKEAAEKAEAARREAEARAARAAAAPPPPPPVCQDCGTVSAIQPVQAKGEGSGLGAAAGAVLGGVIGHQFGGGSGQKAATAAGAIGGALAGNEVEKRMKGSTYYAVTVNMDNGSVRTVNVADATGLAIGGKVRVVGDNLQPR
ncbi:MAG TPA: glycine zipper 2TM domain-containing protein [Nevskiaceae bacterium]|nr:glycine zipper 2TM domain-containing protein [Nevskiaceae bacterium]